jgi:hypothetical protein
MLFGVPYIELNSQTYVALRGYESQNDKSKLSFLYFVGTGEETPTGVQLDLAFNSTITLNGGSIYGIDTGLNVDLESMPTGGKVGESPPRSGLSRIRSRRSRACVWECIRHGLNVEACPRAAKLVIARRATPSSGLRGRRAAAQAQALAPRTPEPECSVSEWAFAARRAQHHAAAAPAS